MVPVQHWNWYYWLVAPPTDFVGNRSTQYVTLHKQWITCYPYLKISFVPRMAQLDVKFFVECTYTVALARANFGDSAHGMLTVAHYSCTHMWRCSGQCHCCTVQLYPGVALFMVVSLSHTTAVSTDGASHSSITVAHYSCIHGWRCSW